MTIVTTSIKNIDSETVRFLDVSGQGINVKSVGRLNSRVCHPRPSKAVFVEDNTGVDLEAKSFQDQLNVANIIEPAYKYNLVVGDPNIVDVPPSTLTGYYLYKPFSKTHLAAVFNPNKINVDSVTRFTAPAAIYVADLLLQKAESGQGQIESFDLVSDCGIPLSDVEHSRNVYLIVELIEPSKGVVLAFESAINVAFNAGQQFDQSTINSVFLSEWVGNSQDAILDVITPTLALQDIPPPQVPQS